MPNHFDDMGPQARSY